MSRNALASSTYSGIARVLESQRVSNAERAAKPKSRNRARGATRFRYDLGLKTPDGARSVTEAVRRLETRALSQTALAAAYRRRGVAPGAPPFEATRRTAGSHAGARGLVTATRRALALSLDRGSDRHRN